MDFQPTRALFGLIAVGGAVAVGVTTRDAGFTALTFIGGLALPRILGVRGHRRHGGACVGGRGEHMRARFENRMESWHRQAHGEAGSEQAQAAGTAGA